MIRLLLRIRWWRFVANVTGAINAVLVRAHDRLMEGMPSDPNCHLCRQADPIARLRRSGLL